ncbi:23S rRNA pseudouridine2604 synthase [Paucibacter oligotrophus]|uniref:Dual-specificity RNA pseudouridine synthase RluF n=1 Tax=Roseateles oligotrophus TaxID=1769250 RepID=A0A840LE07_9BURK|nr:pseudouridine synthase [Roseateles oligotrophus]MBB4844299.1 23S rRNA pseudouridine2604 synthase [Roseateles oligotrophus]
MATLKLNKKKNAGPPASSNRNAEGERRAPIRGKGVSRPRQSLEAAKAEREQRQAQYEQRRPARGAAAGERGPGRIDERGDGRGPGFAGGPRGDARGARPDSRGPRPAYGRDGGREGWRQDGPRYEGRQDGRPDGRHQEPRFEGRNEGRGGYEPRRDQEGYPARSHAQQPTRDPRDPRFARDSRGPGHGGPAGYGPRGEDRRPAHGQQQGPRRAPDERGGQERWQGQGQPRQDAYRDQRQDQRRASSPRPYPNQGPRDARGPAFNRAAEQAGQNLPAHLREAAAKLARQLGDEHDDDEDDVKHGYGHGFGSNANAEGVRLSKQMGVLGLASRREADEWIAAGWVRVDGKLAVLGQRVSPEARIEVDPLAHKEQAKRVTILLNKPIGYVSGQAEDGYEPASVLIRSDNHWAEDTSGIKYHIGHSRGLAPAGRLDIDSTGLLVLTQDGRIAKVLIGEDSAVEKEYLVRVEYHGREGQGPAPELKDGPTSAQLPAADLALLNHGLALDGVQLKPAKVGWQNDDQLRFVLREGRKRQIRRMCEQVGLKVVGLKRVRIGRINLGNLPVGQWRFLTPWERFD